VGSPSCWETRRGFGAGWASQEVLKEEMTAISFSILLTDSSPHLYEETFRDVRFE